jgi:hypothetical protein
METILSSKPGKAPLVLGDELRVEGRQPVAGDLQVEAAGPGQHGFGPIAIPAIRPFVGLPGLEMMVELGVQHPFGKRLLEPVQQASLGQGRPRVRPAQELVHNLIRDQGLFVSRHTMAPSAASYGPKHGISDSPDYWLNGPGKDVAFITYMRSGRQIRRPITASLRKPPSRSGQRSEAVVLRMLLRQAAKWGYIREATLPDVEVPRVPANARPSFEVSEFTHLEQVSLQRIADPKIND